MKSSNAFFESEPAKIFPCLIILDLSEWDIHFATNSDKVEL